MKSISGNSADEILSNTYDLGFVGENVDARGTASIEAVMKSCKITVKVAYNPTELEITIGDDTINAEAGEIYSYLNKKFPAQKVIIEATTAGVAEIFLLLKAYLNEPDICCDLIYVEPIDYTKKKANVRDFSLTDYKGEFAGIPGAIVDLSDSVTTLGLFFVGYEGNRIARAFEDNQMLNAKKCAVVFGVPAFQPGWEMNSFSANIHVIHEKRMGQGTLFCAANSPIAALKVLERAFKAIGPNEKMFVAPMGTKPTSIAAAYFAASKNTDPANARVGLLFDHQIRKTGRTTALSKWHLIKCLGEK